MNVAADHHRTIGFAGPPTPRPHLAQGRVRSVWSCKANVTVEVKPNPLRTTSLAPSSLLVKTRLWGCVFVPWPFEEPRPFL